MGLFDLFRPRDEVWEARRRLRYFRDVIVKCKKCRYIFKVQQEHGMPECPKCLCPDMEIVDTNAEYILRSRQKPTYEIEEYEERSDW